MYTGYITTIAVVILIIILREQEKERGYNMKSVMKKLLLVAIVATMAVLPFALTACAGRDMQLDEFDTITVATNAEFAPWESVDENGNYYGFDIDLIQEIGKRMGKNVEITNMDFDAIISAINSGTHLVGVGALTINPERQESVNFTKPYYSDAYQVVVVHKSNTAFDGLTSKDAIIAQLEGAKINVAKGQVGQAFAKGSNAFGYSGIKNAKVKIFKTVNLAMQGCNADTVALSDDGAAKKFVASNADYKIIDVPLTQEGYGFAVKKSNKTILAAMDKVLAEIIEDGTLDKLIAKYPDINQPA